MKELLEKWAQLEPDRVYVSRDETGEMLAALAKTQPLAGVRLGVMDFHALALTQAAVQEAIEARAWHWQTFYFPEATGDKHRAAVDGFNTPTYEPLKEFAAPSAAEALLSAYLTALEAQG